MTNPSRKLTRNGLAAVGLVLALLWLSSLSVPTAQNPHETDAFADKSGVVEDIEMAEDASQVEITSDNYLRIPVGAPSSAAKTQQMLGINSVIVLKDGTVTQVFDEKQDYSGETIAIATEDAGKYTVKYNIEQGWTESFAFVRTQDDVTNYRPLPAFR